MKIITQQRLKECLNYDPKSGVFTWLVCLGTRNKVGDIAGRICNGQRQIGIDGGQYAGGTLAWLYVTGEFPLIFIDHKNHDGDDNRFENLRKATRLQNNQNRRAFKIGTSGYKGVSLHRRTNKWRAQITINKKHHSLGLFNKKESAAIAYDVAAAKHFGEFAVLNFPTAPARNWILI